MQSPRRPSSTRFISASNSTFSLISLRSYRGASHSTLSMRSDPGVRRRRMKNLPNFISYVHIITPQRNERRLRWSDAFLCLGNKESALTLHPGFPSIRPLSAFASVFYDKFIDSHILCYDSKTLKINIWESLLVFAVRDTKSVHKFRT
jgi:hypothetical protein